MHKRTGGWCVKEAVVFAVSNRQRHHRHHHHHHHHRSTFVRRFCRATNEMSDDNDDDGERASASLVVYPGTAEERLQTCKNRAKGLTEDELSRDWETLVRPKLLWAAGLRDVRNVAPGKGYTGHCFNDFNHVDATTMLMHTADNEHDGSVRGIALGNQLGDGIRAASLPDAGPGGSWCTCSSGANQEPPHDVAHVQFQSKIAWKLVWVPGEAGDFSRFVLVDENGKSLTTGVPTGNVPRVEEREHNFRMLRGGRYAECAKEYESSDVNFGGGFGAR